jgi:hypothetical protein
MGSSVSSDIVEKRQTSSHYRNFNPGLSTFWVITQQQPEHAPCKTEFKLSTDLIYPAHDSASGGLRWRCLNAASSNYKECAGYAAAGFCRRTDCYRAAGTPFATWSTHYVEKSKFQRKRWSFNCSWTLRDTRDKLHRTQIARYFNLLRFNPF